MRPNSGKLVVIVGLPGSGKSRLIKSLFTSGEFIANDYMGHALCGVPKITYSRVPDIDERAALRWCVRNLRYLILRLERRVELERVFLDAVEGLRFQWIFFENAPVPCRENILRRAREEGRSWEGTLEELEKLSPIYEIPVGINVQPVYRVLAEP